MVDSVVTKQELIDAQKDAQSLEDVINGPADTRVKPRIGPEMWTLATINSLVQQGQIKISDLSEAIQIALAAGAGSAGWTASLVVDGSGKNQQEINNNTAYFYLTVSQMAADQRLKDGAIVATKGYHNASDKGGAIYLISSVSTDYSILLANGLHAVFSDVFDVRKFGLRDDPTFTIDQTEEIRRMINYADSRFYEIDFHGFRIKTPEIISHTSRHGVTYRGMPFNKVHTLKNLEIQHNRGIDLIPEGLIGIGFYPKSASDVSGLFRLSNVKFDPILQNYRTTIGYADGAFIGFHADPHIDWDYLMWNVVDAPEFPIDFDFQDIDFKSPAMSYNISVSGWKSRKVTWNNMTGDFLGLYIFSCATRIIGDSINAVYRKDLHKKDRLLVRSAVHVEPETGPNGSIKIDLIDVKNVKVRDSDGNTGLGYFSFVNGELEINELKLKNIDGYSEVYVNYGKGGTVGKLTLDNTKEYTLNGIFTEITVSDSITSVHSKSNIGNNGVLTTHPLGNTVITNLNFKGGAIVGKLTDGSAYSVVRNMTIDETSVSTQEYLLDTPDIDTYRITAKSVDFKDSSKFIRSKFGRIDLQGVTLKFSHPISDFISRGNNGGTVSTLNCILTPQSGNLVSANGISVVFGNTTSSKSLESLVPSSPYVESRLSSFAAIQVPSGSTGSIANDATFTVSASAQYCHVGDTFDVSTNVPFAGCLVFARCETNGTITVRVKNFSGGEVGLDGVVFNVHRLTIN